MAERINPPDNDPDPQDRAAVHGQIKPEGRADRDTSPSANDRAGDEKQPGKLRQAVTTTIATGIIGLGSYANLPPHQDLAEGQHDRSEQTAKADDGIAADGKGDAGQVPDDQVIRPSDDDRYVAEASAQAPEPENGMPSGEGLMKWRDENGNELLTAIVEDQEKRDDEP
jgi:hypothetical protein